MIASASDRGARARAGRLLARVAFREAAAVYEALTDSAPWRADCAALAALLPPGRVLDLGTGPGTSAIEIALAAPGARLVGLDLSPAMLRRARRRAARAGIALPLVNADGAALPFRDRSFDGAVGHSFLYLLAEPDAVLREVARVVRPGGAVAFLEPCAGAPDLASAAAGGVRFAASMALWRAMSSLHRRFEGRSATELLARAGFAHPRAFPVLAGCGLVLTGAAP
jgi:ubiquinone/menaquinone biosynthesis C-methylase UbiE